MTGSFPSKPQPSTRPSPTSEAATDSTGAKPPESLSPRPTQTSTSKDSHPSSARISLPSKPESPQQTERIVSIDIERRPLHVKTWGLWDQNIGIGQILEDSRMVSFAAITEGDRGKPLFRSEFHNGRTKMLNDLWAVLDEADHIISYNGKSFDIKHINTELLKEGLPEPSKYDHTDLLPFVRRKFKFDSNKLDYVSQRMRVGKKLDHGVSYFTLLDGCEAGDKKCLTQFKKYNIQDTLLNLELYREFKELGWL